MLPELFHIGPVTVYSYGLMIAIGVISAWLLGEKRANATGLNGDSMIKIGIVGVVGGLLGAKILYWITILPEIIENPSLLLAISGGFVVFGGLIGGVLSAVVYCRIAKIPFLKYFDVAGPLIALAQGFGRIGCFLAGCCYGEETDSILGVVFEHSHYAPSGVKVLPTQLISSGLDFLNFLVLSYLWKKGKMKDGMVGACYIITYSVGRFILEFFRGDIERGSVGTLSTSQFISIFTGILGVGLLLWFHKRGKLDRSNKNETDVSE